MLTTPFVRAPFPLQASRSTMALRNMLDGDGQDQFDAGGWCFPKPIPPVQRNGDWIVMDPMMPAKTNEAFVDNLRAYPGEKHPRNKKDWQSVQGGSILTICKLHPSQRPPMVRPGDDNEVRMREPLAHPAASPTPHVCVLWCRARTVGGCGCGSLYQKPGGKGTAGR